MFIYILIVFCSHDCITVNYTLRELFGQPQLSLKRYLCVKGVCLCVHTCDCMFIILLFSFLQWWLGGLAATLEPESEYKENTVIIFLSYVTLNNCAG